MESTEPVAEENAFPLRRAALAAALTAILAFILYALTLQMDFSEGDHAEFQLVPYIGGMAHPPGYGLWGIVGKIFLLPFFWLPPATAMNLMTAFFAAAAVGVVVLLSVLWTRQTTPGILAGMLFATTHIMWDQSTLAEVYTLQTFLILLTLLLTLAPDIHDVSRPWSWRWAGGITGGLAIGFRPDSLICVIPVLLYTGLRCRERRDAFRMFGLMALVVAGVVPSLAYCVWADLGVDHPANLYNLSRPYLQAAYDQLPPNRSYYSKENADVLLSGAWFRRLIWLFTCEHIRYAYGETGWKEGIREVKSFFTLTYEQMGWTTLALAALGAVVRKPGLWRIVLLEAAIVTGYLASYAKVGIPGTECYYLPLWAILATWTARGLSYLRPVWFRMGLAILLLALVVVQTFEAYPRYWERRYPEIHAYHVHCVRTLARTLDSNAVVASEWGPLNALQYSLWVERKRDDVVVASIPIWEATSACELLAPHYPNRPLYVYYGGHFVHEFRPASATEPARLVRGIVWDMVFPDPDWDGAR